MVLTLKREGDSMEEHKNNFENKIILITGGAGAIGTNLTRTIAGLGARMVILFHNMSAG